MERATQEINLRDERRYQYWSTSILRDNVEIIKERRIKDDAKV